MKKHLIICIALMALMSSCLQEPDIYRLLPDEDAAAIPYQKGDKVSFLNQDGDTISFVVAHDTLVVYDYYDYYPLFEKDAKTSVYQAPYCYSRTVELRSLADNTSLEFTVTLDKRFAFSWRESGSYFQWYFNCQLTGETQTVTINGTTYDNVFLCQEYDIHTGEPFYQWYYSEDVGLISVKYGDRSLTLNTSQTSSSSR